MKQVLLIEDDPVIAKTLKMSLSYKGFSITVQDTLAGGRQAFEKENFDLILLDLQLPDGSGIDLCRQIRTGNKLIPILMITAKNDEATAVESLTNGADDYIRKPFGLDELTARMGRLLDRKALNNEIINYRSLCMNLASRQVWVDKNEVVLARREFDILVLLVERAGDVVSREDILNAISSQSEIFDRTVDSHLSHLRKKLKSAGILDIQIMPVYGVGYRLETTKKVENEA